MFILPGLIADRLLSLFDRFGWIQHGEGKAWPNRWVNGSIDKYFKNGQWHEHRALAIGLPIYRHGYSLSWDDYRMQKLSLLWFNSEGFRTFWSDCD